jgi:hypothetical protein
MKKEMEEERDIERGRGRETSPVGGSGLPSSSAVSVGHRHNRQSGLSDTFSELPEGILKAIILP